MDDASPYETAPAPQPPRRHRGRWLATGAVVVLALGVGGAGGRLAGGIDHGTAGSSSTRHSTAFGGGQGSQTLGGQGSPYDDGTSPYGDDSLGDQGGSTSDQSTTASASQIQGLVRIDSTLGYQDGEAAGTGMILTSDGEVVTNHHVVAGSTSLTATVMSTGETYTAKVVGTDATDDVAVLQLEGASGLSTVSTDTSDISVGDAVTAVGDANGTEDSLSAATGQVLALDQSITTQSEQSVAGEKLRGVFEISSDVISGDSGGATYDDQGDVVGMTTAASSGDSDVVGYAIPISKVLSIADDLEARTTSSEYAYGHPAFLGIALGDDTTTVGGVYQSTPAARAGVEEGDTITAIDGTSVSTSAGLRQVMAGHSPGDSVSLSWTDADGQSHTATVSLAAGPVS